MDSKTKVIVGIMAIAIVVFAILNFQTQKEQKINYTIAPAPILEMVLPCLMNYYENSSIYVGKAKSSDDAAKKWFDNVEELEKRYIAAVQSGKNNNNDYDNEDLYGNFLWSKSPENMRLKYRTSNENYSKNGWYISTGTKNWDYVGQFLLSDDGLLMVADQTCTRIGCCM